MIDLIAAICRPTREPDCLVAQRAGSLRADADLPANERARRRTAHWRSVMRCIAHIRNAVHLLRNISSPQLARAIAAVSFAIGVCAASPASAGIAQWTTNGPYGGFVSVLAVDPQTPANLYAAGFSSVFKSADGGAHWAMASNGITDPSVAALAIDPVTPTTLYAGSVFGGQMIKSTDGAASWNTLANAPTLVVAIGIDPEAPATLYASQEQSGIYKSPDSGGTWTQVGVATLPGFPTFKSLIVDPKNSNTVYAGENGQGVYKSVDAGMTWSPANTGFTGPIIQIFALAIDPSTPATLYASASTSGGQGIYKTTDGGGHWASILSVGTAFVIQTIAVDPQTSSTLYIGRSDGNVYKSVNGGTSFVPVTTGLPGYGMLALAINPQSTNTVYVASTNGVFKTVNGGTGWSAQSNGLALTTVYAVAVDPTTPTTIYAGTRFSGIFKSIDGGGSWASIYTGLGTTGNLSCAVPQINSIAIDPVTPGTLYAGTQCTFSNGVLKSTNGGTTWAPSATGLPVLVPITAVAVDPQSTSTVYAGSYGSGLFQSTNGGLNWSAASGVPLADHVSGLSVAVPPPPTVGPTAVFVSTSDDGAYFLQGGGMFQPLGLNRGKGDVRRAAGLRAAANSTLPGGRNQFGGPCLESIGDIFAEIFFYGRVVHYPCYKPSGTLGYSSVAGPAASAGLSNAVADPVKFAPNAVPTEAQVVWGPPDGDNAEVSACTAVASIVGNPFDAVGFYAGSGCGVLKGTNLGQQLVTMNTGLQPNQQMNAIGITPAGDKLYAGATSGGVYQYTFSVEPPTQLAITSVNLGVSPLVGSPFTVAVQAQAADTSAQSVAAATAVQLSLATGTGTLGGTLTCTINAGAKSCTIIGVTYSKAEAGVVVTATRTSGDALTPGSSPPFTVTAIPTYSVTYDGNGNTGGAVPIDGTAYTSGAVVTVLGNTGGLVRTGFTFGNWNTAADGSGTPYVGGASFAIGAVDVTLYAHWSLAGSAPVFSGALSRKVHGAAGPFDLPL